MTQGQPVLEQFAVLSGIALLMTVGVYGLVAGIVKLDDLGLNLSQRSSAGARRAGAFILAAAPWLMKTLSVLGTAAMFLVGGGILAHGVPMLHHGAQALAEGGGIQALLLAQLFNAGVGLVAGAIVLGAVTLVSRLRRKTP